MNTWPTSLLPSDPLLEALRGLTERFSAYPTTSKTMDRITDRHIDGCCETLNEMLGLPVAPYVDGKAQQGCIHSDHAYGGVSIVQMSWREGCSGTSTLSDTGTKREAWQWLCAAIRGAQLMRDSSNAD